MGGVAGAAFSAAKSDTSGATKGLHPGLAYAGGLSLVLGSRIAGGCTSGHGISVRTSAGSAALTCALTHDAPLCLLHDAQGFSVLSAASIVVRMLAPLCGVLPLTRRSRAGRPCHVRRRHRHRLRHQGAAVAVRHALNALAKLAAIVLA